MHAMIIIEKSVACAAEQQQLPRLDNKGDLSKQIELKLNTTKVGK